MKLQGGQTYRTQDTAICGQVAAGSLLVYIVPYEGEIPGKKMYLCTVSEGDYIPFLDMEMSEKHWNFQLAAQERAEIRFLKAGDMPAQTRKTFAKNAGVLLFDESGFQEEMIEKYNMAMMKEEAYVYASAQDRIRSIENCRHLIQENLIAGKRRKKTGEEGMEGNLLNKDPLYKAFSFLCARQGYDILPFEKLKEKFQRGMEIFQMASACGIPARKIRLEPEWQRKNIGTFLGYTKDDYVPVVLFRKAGRYLIYDPAAGETRRVDSREAEKIDREAVTFYRSFGKNAVDLKGLLLFGFRETSAANWAFVFALVAAGALAALIFPVSYEYLTDVLVPAGEYELLLDFGIMIAMCMAGYFCISLVKNTAVYSNINHIQNSVMAAVYDRLMHLPEDMIRNYDSADLAQRAIKAAEIFRDASRELVNAAISLVFALIFGVCMLMYDVRTGAGIAVCAGIFGVTAYILCRRHVEAEKEKQREEGMLNSLMYQYLCGIQKIRTDGMEDRALYEYLKRYTKMCRIELRQSRDTTWIDMFSRLYSGITFLLLFLLFLGQMSSGDTGRFVALLTVSELFAQSVVDVVMSVVEADFIFPTYERCRPILECPSEAQDSSGSVGKLDGSVEASNVSFSYSKEEGSVLEDVSIRAGKGDYIGIVGTSGCGKSTLLQILLGFEKPDKGCVFYDHKNLDHISKPDLRKKLGVVLQDESLFTGSIYENISASVAGMTQEQAWKLLDEVSLKEEVEQMPMGLHTLVTESGSTISGGQKQRILLARALAGKPTVLFLDEATSALDNETQGKIIKMLEKRRMTRIVIAHRINTVKRCDRIFVMDHGKIVEEGTYDELLNAGGTFYELAKRQMLSAGG